MKEKSFKLQNGVELPVVGFGTYLATEGNGKQTITDALESGYRYLDTASFYGNESEIGEAIKESGIPRKELFLASKVWKDEMGYEETKAAFERSLKRLQTDYLDLYLIHWPKSSANDATWKEKLQETWRAIEDLYAEGKIRAIGVSNFLPHHLETLLEKARIVPMVNQLELHVGYLQPAAVAYCRNKNIQVQAWSPLGRRRILQEEIVLSLARKYQVTPAQFLLGFLYQEGFSVIPKASAKERMLENQQIFDFTLSEEDKYFLECLPQMGWSGEHPDL
jgi:diketogulonate reductase-like aldo/keto reductase